MSWEDQGRQYHMWFGHGTAPDKIAAPDPSVTAKGSEDRVLALAYGAIGALPASLRGRVEAQHQRGTLPRLKEAMTAWIRGTRLDRDTFANRFFGREASDPVVRNLHAAALGAATATSHEDIRDAAGKLANAIKAVGVDRWPQFVAEASERARDPATQAAIEKSKQPPDPARDAIRPVYPIETAIGVGGAGIVGGVGAAARAVGGAILRQVSPGSRPAAGGAPAGTTAAAEKPPGSPASPPKQGGTDAPPAPATVEKPVISRQKQDGHVAGTAQSRNRIKQGTKTSTFDGASAEADALTHEAWEKGSPVPGRPGVRDYDFGRRVGTAPSGESQSVVRVHQDSAGRIHGHPSGRELQ